MLATSNDVKVVTINDFLNPLMLLETDHRRMPTDLALLLPDHKARIEGIFKDVDHYAVRNLFPVLRAEPFLV